MTNILEHKMQNTALS